MKLVRNIILSAFIISSLCSCNKEQNIVSDAGIPVSYTVSLLDTKAVNADGSAINKVWYALYKTDGTLVTNYAPVDFVAGSARCEVIMMRGQSYKIAFVAQYYKDSATPTYQIDPQEAIIASSYSPIANSDQYDLFYGVDEVFNYSGSHKGSIVLDRVVAMVNFICTDEDWESAIAQNDAPTHSSITLSGVSTGWNILSGEPFNEKTDLSFARSEIPGAKHLGASFCIADGQISATLNLYKSADETAAPIKTLTVSGVQVERNKKSNITGKIITE